MGLSPALKRGEGEDWFRADRWPPHDLGVLRTWTRAAAPPAFRDDDWSVPHFAVAVLTEFASLGGASWANITIPGPPTDKAEIEAELRELQEIAEFRAGLLAEALEQRSNIVGYFSGLLTFKDSSHPWTWRLCHAAVRVGQFVVLHHKKESLRARPSMLAPALMPPLDPPGHPAYPSGHATEAYLLALVLAQVMPAIASGEPFGGARMPVTQADLDRVKASIVTRVDDDKDTAKRMRLTPLWRIAQRVARNREVIGVHFRSDSEAGLRLAVQILPLLLACPLLAGSQGALARAKAEWN
jgi:membrane-associated phospholipid phosphatase